MKKIISFLIIFSVINSLFLASVFAIETPTAENESDTNAINIVTSLGIMSTDKEGQFNPNSSVTRAEFVSYIVKMLNINSSLNNTPPFLKDVDASQPYSKDIYSLHTLGIISTPLDRNFYPENIIKYEEALKMLLIALGYKQIADQKGGYPTGYYNVANSLKLYSSKAITNEVDKLFCAKLLYSVLDVDILNITSISDDGYSQYNATKGENVLTEYYKINKLNKAIVQANSQTSLDEKGSTSKNNIRIDGVVYNVGTTDAEDYIGMYVIAYVTSDRDDTNEILFITPYKYDETIVASNKILTDSENFSYESFIYETVNDEEKKIVIDKNARIIRNGEYIAFPALSDCYPAYGTVKLVDNDGDGNIDVLLVTDALEYVVKNLNIADMTISDKLGRGTIDLSDEKVKIFYQEQEVTFGAIKEGNVIWVCKDKNEKILNVYVFDKTITGKITETRNETVLKKSPVLGSPKIPTNVMEVLIDNVWYTISDNYYLKQPHLFAAKLDMGTEFTFYLDGLDTICASSEVKINEGLQYGWLYNVDKGKPLKDEVSLELFCSDGNFKIFKLPKRIEFNDVSMETKNILPFFINNNIVIRQIVAFKLNDTEQINILYTVTETGGLTKTTIEKKYFTTYGLSFSGIGSLNEKSSIFIVPTDGVKSNHFVVKPSYFKEVVQTVTLFNIDKYTKVAGAVVITASSASGQQVDETINDTIIKKVTKVFKDDQEMYLVYGFKAGVSYKAYFEPEGKSNIESKIKLLKTGDIVQFEINAAGGIIGIRNLFDSAKPGLADLTIDQEPAAKILPSGFAESTDYYLHLSRRVVSKIKYINMPYFVTCMTENPTISDERGYWVNTVYNTAVVYEYDALNKKISVKKLSDIKENDYIYLRTRYNLPITIVILKNISW
jgi:hypothetical protein